MSRRLLVGFKAGDLRAEMLSGEVTCHTLDIYHAHAIEKVFPRARVVCTPHLPAGPWDEIVFRTGPKVMSGELSLDLLQEIHLLKPAAFRLDFVGKERDRNDLLDKVRKDPDRVRDFSAVWPASVPGGEKLFFTSYPGCFCHRRLDEGGLALAEVVTREMTNEEFRMKNGGGVSLLDMGCGCGLVGLLIAKRISGVRLTLIDSHTRAVEAARKNAAAFGVEATVILSDDGLPTSLAGEEMPRFDVFVGNPPYYSDYRIAEVFLTTAQRALKSGGTCYTVVKNETGLKPVQERFFPSVEVIRRRGYAVLKSVRQ